MVAPEGGDEARESTPAGDTEGAPDRSPPGPADPWSHDHTIVAGPPPVASDETLAAGPPPVASDETVAAGPPPVGPAGTSILPSQPDLPSQPRWAARASVPQVEPQIDVEEPVDAWAEPPSAVVPVLVTICVMLLLAILGLGAWLLLANRPSQPPVAPTSQPPASASAGPSSAPSQSPSPSPSPSPTVSPSASPSPSVSPSPSRSPQASGSPSAPAPSGT